MPLQLTPIQLPTTPEGRARTAILLIFDGSGLAFEYTALLPLDRLVYGVSITLPKIHSEDKEPFPRVCEEYLEREFPTVEEYVDGLVRVIEGEIFGVGGDDNDGDDDGEGTEDGCGETLMDNRMCSLHIGGFSFGGFLAIELTRRLVFQTIHPIGRKTPVHLHIPSTILFDSYNPSAPQVRPMYQDIISTGGFYSSPNLAKYQCDHPLMSFVPAHMLHLTKLVAGWKLEPLASKDGEGDVPPVYYFGAIPGRVDGSCDSDAEEAKGYWTESVLPTLDFGRVGMVDSDHLGIWTVGKVEGVTEWLKGVLCN